MGRPSVSILRSRLFKKTAFTTLVGGKPFFAHPHLSGAICLLTRSGSLTFAVTPTYVGRLPMRTRSLAHTSSWSPPHLWGEFCFVNPSGANILFYADHAIRVATRGTFSDPHPLPLIVIASRDAEEACSTLYQQEIGDS